MFLGSWAAIQSDSDADEYLVDASASCRVSKNQYAELGFFITTTSNEFGFLNLIDTASVVVIYFQYFLIHAAQDHSRIRTIPA
jgi:hypothetical protein